MLSSAGGSQGVAASTLAARPTYHAVAVRFQLDTSTSAAVPLVTLHHSALSVKRAELVFVEFSVIENTVVGFFDFRLRHFTGAPTGGTPTAMTKALQSDPSAECVFTVEPTAAGSLVGDLDVTSYRLGVIANQVGSPFVNTASYTHLPPNFARPPTLRPGVEEGWSVEVTGSAVSTQTWSVNMILVEQ